MKTTVVPAQVTTVEDRVAGNLGLSQLMLLAAPVFGGSALYVILPPSFHSAAYKLVVIIALFVVSSLLAIRIKGKILLLWLIVMLRYDLRPRFYVFDKRSLHGRELYNLAPVIEQEEEEVKTPHKAPKSSSLSTADVIELQDLIENPAANVSFETKKGNLYVRITEIKQEG
jgi:hypothetical protein